MREKQKLCSLKFRGLNDRNNNHVGAGDTPCRPGDEMNEYFCFRSAESVDTTRNQDGIEEDDARDNAS